MTKSILTSIKNSSKKGKKLLAILLDLDKISTGEKIRDKIQLDNVYNNEVDVVIIRTALENNTLN